MLRHQISEIIREIAVISLHNDRVSKGSSMKAADSILELLSDEAELRAGITDPHLRMQG